MSYLRTPFPLKVRKLATLTAVGRLLGSAIIYGGDYRVARKDIVVKLDTGAEVTGG